MRLEIALLVLGIIRYIFWVLAAMGVGIWVIDNVSVWLGVCIGIVLILGPDVIREKK